MAQVLTEDVFLNEMRPSFERIFVGEDPYGAAFASTVERRYILFPYELFPPPSLTDALATVCREQGEQGFYVSILGRPPVEKRQHPYHLFVPFEDAQTYDSIIGPVEHAVYSLHGTWGMIGSYEWHGLLGATNQFMQRLEQFVPTLESQVRNFLAEFKDLRDDRGGDLSWLPNLMGHIYGLERGQKMLQDAGIIE